MSKNHLFVAKKSLMRAGEAHSHAVEARLKRVE